MQQLRGEALRVNTWTEHLWFSPYPRRGPISKNALQIEEKRHHLSHSLSDPQISTLRLSGELLNRFHHP